MVARYPPVRVIRDCFQRRKRESNSDFAASSRSAESQKTRETPRARDDERSRAKGAEFTNRRRVLFGAKSTCSRASHLSLSFSLSLSLSLSSGTCVHPCLSRQEYRPWRTSRRARRSPRSDLRSVRQNCVARVSAGEFGSEIEIETRATLDDTRTGGIYFQRAMWSDSTRRRENSARCRVSRYLRAASRRETSASTETHGEGRGWEAREEPRKTRSRARAAFPTFAITVRSTVLRHTRAPVRV